MGLHLLFFPPSTSYVKLNFLEQRVRKFQMSPFLSLKYGTQIYDQQILYLKGNQRGYFTVVAFLY